MSNVTQLRILEMGAIKKAALLTLAAIVMAGSGPNDEESNVRSRAEQFLSLLRAEEWKEAAEMVLLNDAAYDRFSITKKDDPVALKKEIARLFKRVYSSVKPGHVVSVKIDPKNSTFASIAYRHDDLDGFSMRLSSGQWYYTFE